MQAIRHRISLGLFIFILLIPSYSCINNYKSEGSLILSGLEEPVIVLRDEKGMAYIQAQGMLDAIMAQGFVTAQDRLFQMELIRRLATGQISEVVGKKGKAKDIEMRTLGFYRNAKIHAKILDQQSQRFMQKYIDGVNTYIHTRKESHPIEFKLVGIQPQPWSVADAIAIMYYMGWTSSGNLNTEVVAQMLVEKLGEMKAREIFPLNINPDDPSEEKQEKVTIGHTPGPINLASDARIMSFLIDSAFRLGSNNWVVGPKFSPSGKPILANDPHLEATGLPGPWYPNYIKAPNFRAVGVSVPGIPGMVIGRNDHVAIGVTNAYGDTQDLYVETIDPENPNRYIEGENSISFEVIEETLTIKDKTSPQGYRKEKVKIKLTKRGPVISDIMSGLETRKVITVRWSPFENMGATIGVDKLLRARSVNDIREALRHVNMIMLNFVFADEDGNFGWLVSGRLPVRSQGGGTIPYVVKEGKDNWIGWIPFDEKPQRFNPDRGWIATCNHKTVSKDYPYYYSSQLGSSYRYRRIKELLQTPGKKSVNDHWEFQRDTLNIMAKEIAPVMARVLLENADTQDMGKILSNWHFRDDSDQTAPAIFQAVYRNFAALVFQDELGEDLTSKMLDSWYFWQERLGEMVRQGSSTWFDNVKTKDSVETMDMLFYQAAVDAKAQLSSRLGNNPDNWRWGGLHTLELVSPIRRKGFGKGILGGGSYPYPGSGETLYRGRYKFHDPFAVAVAANLRMVVDLGDDEKVLAVLLGGVCGRLFHRHTKDQIQPYMNGEKVYWWFSDQAVNKHSETILRLLPQ
ncbi:MAG: penicillin acylase family protein [Deltaproteobacteria bacterium]|nr:penicillin acylase family protein [Deltaproteobacteria bacterium]